LRVRPLLFAFFMENGWIKLHRKLKDWEWYKDANTVRLFIHLLISANHKEHQWRGVAVEKGQVVVGRKSLSSALGISEQSVRTSINRLKSTNEITIKSTNKYSLITIISWKDYQINNQQANQQSTSKQPTTNQQLTTNKKDKKKKNEKNEKNTIASSQRELGDVDKIFDLFYQELNPTINWGNQTSRKAAQFLIDKLGIDKAIRTTEYAISVQGKKYAPTITTPYQLKEKFAALLIFHKKGESGGKLIKI